MRIKSGILLRPVLAAALLAPAVLAQDANLQPPVAKKVPHTTQVNGVTLKDNYFWLRDRKDPDVMKYLEAENAYTAAVMKPTADLQESLYKEMLGHLKQTDLGVPAREGQYFYYARTEEGKQYPYQCRKKGSLDAPEEILLDLNKLAEGHSFLGLGEFHVSDDGNLLAYSTDTTGYRQYTLYVKDLRTGQTLDEHIERVDSVTWAGDNKTLFYTTEDSVSKRSDKFWRHTLGSDKSDLLFEEKDEIFDLGVGRSLDKKMIFLESESKTSHEYRFLPADNPGGQFKIIAPREPGHEYDVNHYEGQFYITTNKDAKNFRVVTAPVSDPSEKNWKPFIEHNPKIKIDGLETFAGHLVISEREGGLAYLRVIDMRTRQSHRITTDESDYDISLGDNREFNTPAIRFNYQSMVTPLSIYDYDLDSRDRKLMKQQEVPGGFDPSRYEEKRIWAVARDGTKVPISIVYKKGVPLDGTAPMWLNGYGSYGLSYAPNFSSNRLALLDRGVIFAMAYIRGGGEMGEEWRDDGRMMSKMNTFYDFIDCAEYLVKNKYTSSDRLVIQGRSAGGMLMGAVTNLRPDLFKAVIAQVPFVDVINTMLDASLPLTTAEYIEWGNPNEKPAFDYMIRYSPYDNVTAKNYPAMLVEVSLNDSQVPYWEGSKLVAKLRATKTDKNVLLLKANLGAGHGGSSGRYDALRETAFDYAFALSQMGITK
ncbi:MAG TPA: S9 family peptidase [Candidatus Acidoferrales bacterium]|nr:S9 family peptidase [Candidatus Acidoferrales bacterium]